MCQGLLEVIASTMKMLQGSVGLLLPKIPLITFDVPVDPPYEQIGTQVTNSSCTIQILCHKKRNMNKNIQKSKHSKKFGSQMTINICS